LIDVGDYQVSGYVTGVYPLPDHPLYPGGHGTIKGPNSTIKSFWLRFGQGIRCSWKLVAIFFMILSFFLVSAFIYSAGRLGPVLRVRHIQPLSNQTFEGWRENPLMRNFNIQIFDKLWQSSSSI